MRYHENDQLHESKLASNEPDYFPWITTYAFYMTRKKWCCCGNNSGWQNSYF